MATKINEILWIDEFERVLEFENKRVCVWYGKSFERTNFDTAIAVCGDLEVHSTFKTMRVVVEKNIYTYFTLNDIESVIHGSLTGSYELLIKLKFE